MPSKRTRTAPSRYGLDDAPAPTIAKAAKKAPVAKKAPPAAKKAPPAAKKAPPAAVPSKAKPKGKAPAAAAAAAPASPPKLVRTTDSFAPLAPDPVVVENGLGKASVLASHKLVLQDLSKNSDKYYVLQSIEAGGEYYVVRRWGRTGTKGDSRLVGPFATLAEADADLCATFKEKTGFADPAKADGSTPKAGKYTMLRAAAALAKGTWQYYVDDGVDGKAVGWYDYFESAVDIVEGVFAEWKSNPTLHVRCVQSGTYSYMVDFNNMTQTNVSHPARKMRQIRRV